MEENGSPRIQKRMVIAWALMLGSLALIAVSLGPNLISLRDADPGARATDEAALEWSLDEGDSRNGWLETQSSDAAEADAPLHANANPEAATAAPRSGQRRSQDSGFDLESSFDCLIESKRMIHVGSSVTGVIESVNVDRSEFVEAGQVLAELESEVEKAAVQIARLRADMKGDVGAHAASARLSASREERAQHLFAANTLSHEMREEMETEAELATFALLRSNEEKELASAELGQAIEVLERRKIRSPISGVVVERLKLPGEVVKEEKVITVAEMDPLQAEVVLPAALFGSVVPGMKAEVTPELGSAGVRVATVDVVDRVIDAASGTFRVRLELPNPDHALPSGLHCQARFLSDSSNLARN